LYNNLTSREGKRYIGKGSKKAGVADVVSEEKKLLPEDPFGDLADVKIYKKLSENRMTDCL